MSKTNPTKQRICFENTDQISTSNVLVIDEGCSLRLGKVSGPGKFISPRLTTLKVLKICSILENRLLSLCLPVFRTSSAPARPGPSMMTSESVRSTQVAFYRLPGYAWATVLTLHNILGNRSLSRFAEIFRGVCTSGGSRDGFCVGLVYSRAFYV